MEDTKEKLLTAATIAKELGISDAKVKKAIKELQLEPAAKRGVCSFYSAETLARVKAALTS